MLTPLDDYPIHQVAEVMRHVATSDRNFYDRYYFNCHPCGPDLFLAAGLGQYPNLGVVDAFAAVVTGGKHHVVRASRELGADRMDTTAGPFRVEVLEGLRRLRIALSGAAPCPWELARDWRAATGVRVLRGYGMTELFRPLSYVAGDPEGLRPGTTLPLAWAPVDAHVLARR